MTTSAPHLIIAAGGTGGHMFPAQALAEAMVRRGWRVTLSTDARGARYTGGFPHTVSVRQVASATFARGGVLAKALVPFRILGGIVSATVRMLGEKTVGRGGLRRLSRDPGHGGGMAHAAAACDPRTERRSGPGEPGVRAPRRCGRLWDLADRASLGRGGHPHRQPGACRDPRARRRPLHAARRLADEPSGLRRQSGRAHPVGRGPRSGGASARGGCATGCAWPSRRGPRISTAWPGPMPRWACAPRSSPSSRTCPGA